MNFRTTLAAFIGIGFLYIVYSAYEQIVAGIALGAQILFGVFVLLLVGGAVGFGALYWSRERNRQLRPIDGSFALMTQRLRRDVVLPDGRVVPKGTEVVINPNNQIGVAVVAHPAYGVVEFEPAAGWDRQVEIRRGIQATHTAQALTVGDGAHVATKGMISTGRGGIANAATGRFLEGAYRPAAKALAAPTPGPVAPVAVPHTPITGQQMVASSSPQPTRLAIGEDSVSNTVVQVDLALYPFLKLHGASGSGKTSLARLLVAQAIHRGYEVDIYDTRMFKDWGIFGQHARLIDSRDPRVLVAGLQEEVQRYKERDAELSRAGVPDLAALSTATGKAYRRRLVVIEEMGTQTLNARDEGKEVYVAYIRALRSVTVNARATGIHGIYLDQVPAAWDSTVRYNSTMICFYLPDHGGKVAGYAGAHNLPQYHAYFEGKVVRTGHLSDGEIQQLIGSTPVRRTDARQGGATGVNTPANTPTNTPANTTANGVANTATNTPANTPTEESQTQWKEFAAVYFQNNPGASQRALTRAMAAVDPLGRKATDFLGEVSSELFHRFSPRGAKYQPPVDEFGWVAGKEK